MWPLETSDKSLAISLTFGQNVRVSLSICRRQKVLPLLGRDRKLGEERERHLVRRRRQRQARVGVHDRRAVPENVWGLSIVESRNAHLNAHLNSEGGIISTVDLLVLTGWESAVIFFLFKTALS